MLLAAVFMNFFPIETDWFGLRDITGFFIYVLLGLYTSKILTGYDGKKISLIPCFVCLTVGAVLSVLERKGQIFNFIGCLMLMGAVLLASLWMAGKQASWINVFSYFGKRAFTVYIYSWPVQAVLEMLVVVVLKGSWQSCFAVLLLCGLCGPTLLYEIYLHFFPRCKFFDLMIGVK